MEPLLFSDISDEVREKAYNLLEKSLFDIVPQGEQFFRDVPATMPGFQTALQTTVPNYKVTINMDLLMARRKQ